MKLKSKKLLVLPVVISLFLMGCSLSGDSSLLSIVDSGKIEPLQDLSFDWGDINIKGGDVEYVFRFRNNGDEDLIIKNALTTCMCTSAVVELADGSTSPEFGMHPRGGWGEVVGSGEEFEVKVVFDPMAHGPDAVGPITRSVFLETSSVPNGNYTKPDSKTGSMVTEMMLSGDVLSEAVYQRKMETSSS